MLKKGFLFTLVLLSVGAYFGYPYIKMYLVAEKSNTQFSSQEKAFYIPTYIDGDSTQIGDVFAMLNDSIVERIDDIELLSAQMNFGNSKVVPGKYILTKGMSNKDIVTQLRGGYGRKEVKITFNNIRLKQELCKELSKQIEASEEEICNLLFSNDFVQKYGFNPNTIMSMFIPNTYRVQWNTSADELMARMATEYKAFWNDERKQKARNIGLSQSEVATLASIVQAEQSVKKDEQATIAGLYINRVKSRMPLQSDPTLVFALGDFSIRRVLNKHKAIDSPYNTYIYAGLPPGPINLPEISALDAVLNFEKNNYYYMCAKPDFSGYHNFARTYSQHLVYARQYQSALNKRNIRR